MTNLTRDIAEKFTALALAHVSREYPNKLDHVLVSAADALGPRALHPIFFGSFDWHSCVHGYWLLARLLRRYRDLSLAGEIEALFDARFTENNVAAECAYLDGPSARGFELEALVDTGAQDSCIDRLLAAQLSLPVVDRQAVCGVHGLREVDVYLAQIYIPALKFTEYGKFAGVELKEGGHRQHILLGRTFLSHFILEYDGKNGTFSLKP